jgi:hypothetical protein
MLGLTAVGQVGVCMLPGTQACPAQGWLVFQRQLVSVSVTVSVTVTVQVTVTAKSS